MFRGLANPASDSRRVIDLSDRRRVLLLLSKPVVDEYRAVLTDPHIVERHPLITPEAVELVLHRLRYVSEYLRRLTVRFHFERDARDEKFIQLAIAGGADYIITYDNDLLSLTEARTDDAKRFRQRMPGAGIVRPDTLVNTNPELFLEEDD